MQKISVHISAGLKIIYPKFNSAKALLELARVAKKLPSEDKEPTDVSEDTAKY